MNRTGEANEAKLFGNIVNILTRILWCPPRLYSGPLLFLLHFNEMPSLLKHCKMIMYADNTVLFDNHKDQQEIDKVLSEEFGTLSSWLRKNELILNLIEGKMKILMFGTKKRLNQQECQINVKYRSQPISTTQSYQYLRVQLDPSLNMKEHVKGICQKVSTHIRLLKRIRPFITDLATLRIYQALIVPSIMFPNKLLSSTLLDSCNIVI